MRFVRLHCVVKKDETGQFERIDSVCIVESELPHERASIGIAGAEMQVLDVGAFMDSDATLQGGFATAAVRAALTEAQKTMPLTEAVSALVGGALPGLPRFYPTPCTLDGLARRVALRGAESVPSPVRAWLAWMLPPARRSGLSLQDTDAVFAKALERNRRGVPHDGDQPGELAVLERRIEQEAGAMRAKRTAATVAVFEEGERQRRADEERNRDERARARGFADFKAMCRAAFNARKSAERRRRGEEKAAKRGR